MTVELSRERIQQVWSGELQVQSSSRAATWGGSLLRNGDVTRVGKLYRQHRKTITRLWKTYNSKQKDNGAWLILPCTTTVRASRGRKGIDLEPVRAALAGIPIKRRPTTIRGGAAALLLGLRKSTLLLLDNLKNLDLRASSRYLQPLLTAPPASKRGWSGRGSGSAAVIMVVGVQVPPLFEDHVHLAGFTSSIISICKNGQQ